MTIINTSPDRPIRLGYEGEDRVTVLRFRYGADWLENGEGIFHIRVRRHGEHTAYNAQLVADDAENNCLLMTVTNVELSVKGSGEMQVVYSGENFAKKSPIYSYNVSRAVDEVADPPAQDVYTQIIESLSDLQTDVSGITEDIGQLESSIGALSALTTAKIGDLTELTTEAKTDLVSAINEVNAKGGTDITVDDALSTTSANPVQNKVVTSAVQGKADIQTVSALADAVNDLDGDVQGLQTSKADKSYVDTQLAEKASTQTVSGLSDDVSDLQTELAEKVGDVQVNGVSVVTDGVANVPVANASGRLGVVYTDTSQGLTIDSSGKISVLQAQDWMVKGGTRSNNPVTPVRQHESTFYGLAKVAGHDEKNSTLPVGQYSEEAKTAIRTMLGLQEMYEWYKNQT